MSESVPRPGRDMYKDVTPEDLGYPVADPVTGDKRTRYPARVPLGTGLGLEEEIESLQEVEGKTVVEVVAADTGKARILAPRKSTDPTAAEPPPGATEEAPEPAAPESAAPKSKKKGSDT